MDNVTTIGVLINITLRDKYANNKIPYWVATTMDPMFIPLGIMGIFGNALSVYVLSKSKSRSSGSEMIIINQSLIDLFASFVVLGMKSYWPFDREHISGWFGQILCIFWLADTLFWCFFTSSSYNLVALTVERYLAVVKPIFHRAYVTRRMIWLTCVMAWLSGPLTLFPVFFLSSRIDKGNCNAWMPPAKWNLVYMVYICLVTFIIPLVMFIGFYAHMMLHLRVKVAQATGSASSKSASTNKSIFRTVLLIVAAYILCNTPNQLPFFEYYLTDSRKTIFNDAFLRWSIFAVVFNFCVNPIVYAFQYEIFRKVRTLLKHRP